MWMTNDYEQMLVMRVYLSNSLNVIKNAHICFTKQFLLVDARTLTTEDYVQARDDSLYR